MTPGYFRALGIRVVRGRALSDADVNGGATAIVINDALARRQFGSEDPVGRVMNRGTIVGVVADVRNVNPDRPAVPELYYSIAQNWSQVSELGMTLVVRTDDRPEAAIDARPRHRARGRSAIGAVRDQDDGLASLTTRRRSSGCSSGC